MKTKITISVLLVLILLGSIWYLTKPTPWKQALSDPINWKYKYLPQNAHQKVDYFSESNWETDFDYPTLIPKGQILCLQMPLKEWSNNPINLILKNRFWTRKIKIYINKTEVTNFWNDDNCRAEPALTTLDTSFQITPYYSQRTYNIPYRNFKNLNLTTPPVLTLILESRDKINTEKLLDTKLFISDNINLKNPYHDHQNKLDSSNLPVIFINTNGANITKDSTTTGKLEVVNNLNTSKQTHIDLTTNIKIKMRGHSSMGYAKKQFSIVCTNDSGHKHPQPLLGLPKGTKWVLNGTLYDISLIRNKLSYTLFQNMGHYSTRSKYCEVFLNNSYQGIFLLTEKVQVATNKLNLGQTIEKKADNNGGWLIEKDRPKYYEECFESQVLDNPFYQNKYYIFKKPKAEKITLKQKEYIIKDFFSFERSIMNKGNYLSLIDTNSFLDYIILNELSKNLDAYRLSVFIHKNSIHKGGKIAIGPAWDFDRAYGISQSNPTSQGFMYNNEPMSEMSFWWHYLMDDEKFVNLLRNRYTTLRSNTLSRDSIFNIIDTNAQLLNEASNRNFYKWEILNTRYMNREFIPKTYMKEIEYVKNWIDQRLLWLDEQWLIDEPI